VNSRQTNNFFIHSSLSGISTAFLQQQKKQFGYYHQLICALLTRRSSTLEGVEQLAKEIAAIAHHAYLARHMDAVEQASQLILALPVSEKLRGVARYYEALCQIQQRDLGGARNKLEQVVENTTSQYRARALQGIGATYFACGEIDNALPFYLAAGKAATNCSVATSVESQWMIAVVRSIHGDHRQALNDLERLFPLVCKIRKYYPARYYDFLNSLAVELSEVGRVAEAQAVIKEALGSPYASVYPVWSETRVEIEQKRNYHDPSHCFIDRSLTKPEAIPDSTAEASVNSETERQTRRETEKVLVYQRPSVLPNTDVLVIPRGSSQSILDLLGRCIQPRAPPVI
jgi:tetratricopeptide (TPR) repeat protein